MAGGPLPIKASTFYRTKMDQHKRITLGLGAGIGACLAAPALAQGPVTPKEGTNYRAINPAQPTEAAGKIEVVEFFWYACPHCYSLEPALKDWVKRLPADVVFRKVHVPFNEERHQQLFYALEALGKHNELSDKVFTAIHVERNRMDTPEKMAEVLAKAQLDPKQFREAYDSFGVKTKMRKATSLAAGYKVDGVPQLGINGRFLTAPSMAGGNGQALAVADYLIAQERSRK
jgi:protein dithiol oxidoreductase (disulfide-forming)